MAGIIIEDIEFSGSGVFPYYDEGTWTPTLVGGTTPGTYGVAIQNSSARWTRIGRLVRVSAFITITATAPGTGNAVFGGLPFAKAANSDFVGQMATSNVDFTAGCIQAHPAPLSVAASAATFGVLESFDNASIGLLPVTAFSTGSQLHIAFEYEV